MRFCWLYLKLPPCARVRHGDEWSWRVRDEENAEKRRGGAIEKEKEHCLVLLSCLSVAGGVEQRKLVGCGVSHVYLTLSDSLLCCSVSHSLHSLWEMCDSFAIVPSPNPPSIVLILDLLPSLPPLFTPSRFKPPQRQVGWSRWRAGRRRSRPPATPQVRRSLQSQYTPHLSLGVTQGWLKRNGGVTHLSPEEVSIGGMKDELKREEGKMVEKQTCPLTFGEKVCVSFCDGGDKEEKNTGGGPQNRRVMGNPLHS